MNISLPECLWAWVQSQIDNGEHATACDYVLDLIRRDQRSAARLRDFQAAIVEGFNSGVECPPAEYRVRGGENGAVEENAEGGE